MIYVRQDESKIPKNLLEKAKKAQKSLMKRR